MTPETYHHIGKLFDEALERAPAERADWLRQTCGADDELRAAVEKLLAHHSEADTFLSRPALEIAAAQTPSFIGQQLGHYRIISLLGAGGMGEVYLAEDETLRRKIALKVLPAYIAQDHERLRRFKLEALAASALNHPNIVTIHEFGTQENTHFIVEELVGGETLRDRLRHGALSVSDALDLTQQVAAALQAAHAAGIIHRDIKPENIMIRPDGLVKVLDFGLAKITDSQHNQTPPSTLSTAHSTDAGTVLGTVAYMSPEQARGQKVDARSDLWSLGVVLYEMLSGQRPFQGESAPDLFVAILERQPAPLPSSSAALQSLLNQLLAKKREQRCASSAQLATELKDLRRQLESSGAPAFNAASEAETLVLHSPAHTAAPPATATTQGEQAVPVTTVFSGALNGTAPPARHRKTLVALLGGLLVAVISFVAYRTYVAPRNDRIIESIAVLPFENRSGKPELAYISDGLSERLIDQLAELPQLKVIARNSSFKFRGTNLDLKQIASQLGVRAIATGSVELIGDQLKVSVEVIDAVENAHLTGAEFQRKADNLLSVQSEVSQQVTEKLRLKLTSSQSKRLAENATNNSEAYRFYLSGLVELNGPQDIRSRALEYFEQAVSLDPEFAAAHTEIAWVYWSQASNRSDPQMILPKAKAATARALLIDPQSAKAHVLQALLNEYDFNWQGAESEYKRAIELSPSLDFARNNYASFLSVTGRHEAALAELEQQRVRDPINQRLGLLQKAMVLTSARKFDDALKAYQDAQAIEPAKEIPYFSLGYAYAGKGLLNEAVTHYKKSINLLGGEEKYSQPLVFLAAIYARMPAKREEARTILNKIEAMTDYRSPALLATVYTALDDNKKALELLEQAYIKRDPLLRFLGVGYEYDRLRNEPGFRDLIKRIGIGN